MAIYVMSDIHGMYGPFMRRIKQLHNLESVKAGEDKLILLGDYVDVGNNSFKVLNKIYELQKEVGENLIVLKGNHDEWFLNFVNMRGSIWITEPKSFDVIRPFLTDEEATHLKGILKERSAGMEKFDSASMYVNEVFKKNHKDLLRWYSSLKLFYRTENQIFVHAGVDEEAEDWWDTGTSDEMFLAKYPPTTGSFYMDIIAGHVSTSSLAKDMSFHDIFWDGESHYYIDGIDSYAKDVWDDDRVIPVLVYEDGKYYSLQENGEKVRVGKHLN